ncbi:hypothetical protein H5T87_01950 [bacterium]|nr:hypothetical protein [bacterium]
MAGFPGFILRILGLCHVKERTKNRRVVTITTIGMTTSGFHLLQKRGRSTLLIGAPSSIKWSPCAANCGRRD